MYVYRRTLIADARREHSQGNRKSSLAPGYGCVKCPHWLHRFSLTVIPYGTHIPTCFLTRKGDGGLGGGSVKSACVRPPAREYLVRVLDDPGLFKLMLPPARYRRTRKLTHTHRHTHTHRGGGQCLMGSVAYFLRSVSLTSGARNFTQIITSKKVRSRYPMNSPKTNILPGMQEKCHTNRHTNSELLP